MFFMPLMKYLYGNPKIVPDIRVVKIAGMPGVVRWDVFSPSAIREDLVAARTGIGNNYMS
jgi:hypothetical protein